MLNMLLYILNVRVIVVAKKPGKIITFIPKVNTIRSRPMEEITKERIEEHDNRLKWLEEMKKRREKK